MSDSKVYLMPCPFCGGEVYTSREDCYGEYGDWLLVHCEQCGLQYGFTAQFESEEEAAMYWNNQSLTANEYQRLAARTINTENSETETEYHALFGMCSEVGELHGIYQKMYQGHRPDKAHMAKELGDLLWFIAEYCTARGWELEDIMQKNIDKLKARYPDGFEAELSLHRKAGDI